MPIIPTWQGRLRFNQLTQRVELAEEAPRIRGGGLPPPPVGELEEASDAYVAAYLSAEFDVHLSPSLVHLAIATAARVVSYHPIREYLRGFTWDGVERVDRLMMDYFGAADTPYHRRVGACFLIGAVARMLRPGCKMDAFPILTGAQGTLKSSSLRALFGEGYYLEDFEPSGDKDTLMALAGCWCAEWSELAGVARREVEKVKAFSSRQTDTFRVPYDREVYVRPRTFVFVGTSNEESILRDATGNRRFLPVRTVRADKEAIVRDRDQLWAEAVARFQADESWWIEA